MSGLERGQDPGEDPVHHRRAMADVEVERIEPRAQVELRVILSPVLRKPL